MRAISFSNVNKVGGGGGGGVFAQKTLPAPRQACQVRTRSNRIYLVKTDKCERTAFSSTNTEQCEYGAV